MKTISLLVCFVCFCHIAKCQPGSWATESHYDFTLKGKVSFHLPGIVDSVFIINAKLKVIRDRRFCLFLLEETSISNSSLPNNGENEEKPDSLFFDMANKIAYNLKEEKSYPYDEKKYVVTQPGKDSMIIKKEDTTIVLLRSLDKLVSPSPTIGEMPFGINSYSGKNFSFKYAESKEIEIALKNIYNRVVNFKPAGVKLPFVY